MTQRVLVVGDTHMPCLKRGYIDHLYNVYVQYECDRVVHIGDLCDNYALSYHSKLPKLKDPIREYEQALSQVKQLTDAFPEADLLMGNHDCLPYRWSQDVGIPEEMLKDYGSIMELPDSWVVHPRYHQLKIDGVIYQHGDRGRSSAELNAKAEFCSVVQGHHHAKSGVTYISNARKQIMAVQTGCGTDYKALAQSYGVKYSSKPVMSCAVVIDGKKAFVEPM